MPFAAQPKEVKGGLLDHAIYETRAKAIRENIDFQKHVSGALAKRYEGAEPSKYVEERIYPAFPSDGDERLKDGFHKDPWPDRVETCGRFEDQRLSELGMRLIYIEHPAVLASAERRRWERWVQDRLTTDKNVPWTTIPKAMGQLRDIKRSATPEVQPQLDAIAEYLEKLAEPSR